MAFRHPLASQRAAWRQPGVAAALGAAALFGAGTPMAKQLLEGVDPWMLAGLLYLGSGLGLGAWHLIRRAAPVRLPADQWLWLAGAVLAGGVVGQVPPRLLQPRQYRQRAGTSSDLAHQPLHDDR
jgi:drug/metabolite transporter (DMT)-like permease